MAYSDRLEDQDDFYGSDPTRNTTQPGGRVNPPMSPVVPPAPSTPPAYNPDPERSRSILDWRVKYGGLPLPAQIRQAYQDFLGREVDDEGFQSMQGNPFGIQGILETLYDSPEGSTYRSRANTGGLTPGPTTGAGTGSFPTGLPQRGEAEQLTGYPTDLGRSMKHVFGAIASRYGKDRGNLAQIMQDPEFQAWFPNARLTGDDTIDFGGQLSDFDSGVPVYEVDVSRGGDDAWQWLDQAYMDVPNEGGRGAGGLGGGGTPDDLLQAILSMVNGDEFGGSQSDVLDRIMAELQAQAQGSSSPMARDALLRQLQGR